MEAPSAPGPGGPRRVALAELLGGGGDEDDQVDILLAHGVDRVPDAGRLNVRHPRRIRLAALARSRCPKSPAVATVGRRDIVGERPHRRRGAWASRPLRSARLWPSAVVDERGTTMDYERIVRSLEQSVYNRDLINNAERGAYVEHMIVLALEGQGWDLTWPWASWDLKHRDGARIEVKQSAARQTWHKRPKPPFPLPSRGKFGINRPSESYYLEDGTYEKTRRPQRHADIYVFAWHPVEDLNEADHRRPDQWEFFVVPEKCLPRPKDDSKTDSITPGQLVKCDRAVHCAYKKLADNVTKVRESLGSLKAEAVVT